MPLFLHALLAWSRRRPALALLAGGLLSSVLYWQLVPAPPGPVRPATVKAAMLPGLGTQHAVLDKTLLDVQKDNAQLRLTLEEQQRTLHAMQQAQAAADRDRAAQTQAQEQRLEALLQRAQQHATRPAPSPRPAPAAAPAPALKRPARPAPPGPAQGAAPAASAPKPALIQILRHDKTASFTGAPPSLSRADTPFVPAGSYAEGRLVTGVFASARLGGALPVLFAVTKAFDGPFQLRGPGLAPRATTLPIAGCLILGKAQADLGSQRVLIQLDTLSCVFPDGATFERPLKGYATGVDGTLGILGRLETRESAYLARTFLTSLLAGASEAFALAKRTVVVTPLGGTLTTQTGNIGESAGFSALAQASAQLSQFYLAQAERLMPVLWAESGTSARLVLQEGLALDGLPTSTILSLGEP